MSNSIILYHGTTHDFTVIDVRKGKPFKDFGQGFYLTETYGHAKNLAERNCRIEEIRLKAIGDNSKLHVFIYEYDFDLRVMDKFNVKRFDRANREWLKFVISNRMNKTHQHNYDIVIGPTANDDTRTSIRTVMNASNGAILSDTALDLLIEMLEPNKLPEQYYFGTNKVAAILNLIRRHELK